MTPPSGRRPIEVRWRVATDVRMDNVVRTGRATATNARDFTVRVDVKRLQPGRYYFYDFEALGRRSIIGRTKTAPTRDVSRLRFGVVSCSNYQGGFFNGYARLAERDDLDAIIHLGDYIYEYGNGADRYGPASGELSAPRHHRPPTEMTTLADYRMRYANYRLDPDLRRLHQLYPWITTWDDHESANNSHRDGAENHSPDEGSWAVRKAGAQRAYQEWLPSRTSDPSKIYRTLHYGELADVIVMDTRLDDRDPEVGSAGMTIVSGEEIDDPDRKMISADQRRMVFDALARKDSTWKIVAQQVIVGQWNAGGAPTLPAAQDRPRFVVRDGGNALNPDQWDGYTAERNRLFGHIRDKGVENVVVLTGDVHTSWALDLVEDPYNPLVYNPLTGEGALGVEFVTPSITSANFESLGVPGAAAFEAVTRADNPHVKFVDFTSHGYFVLDLTTEAAQADWYFVDTVLEPSDTETFGASWKVEAGANHVSEATGPRPKARGAPGTPPGDTTTRTPLAVAGAAAMLARVITRRTSTKR